MKLGNVKTKVLNLENRKGGTEKTIGPKIQEKLKVFEEKKKITTPQKTVRKNRREKEKEVKTPKAVKTIEKRKKTKHKENELKSRKLFFENFSSIIGRGSPAKFNSKTNLLLVASTSRMPENCADQ